MELREKIEAALDAALERQEGFIGRHPDGGPRFDGEIDLTELAKSVLVTVMERPDKPRAAAECWVDMEDGMGWLPIESAPKDGTEFVMLDVNVDTATVGHWMADVEWMNKGRQAGEALIDERWFPLATPTHWMPLPPPPTDTDTI